MIFIMFGVLPTAWTWCRRTSWAWKVSVWSRALQIGFMTDGGKCCTKPSWLGRTHHINWQHSSAIPDKMVVLCWCPLSNFVTKAIRGRVSWDGRVIPFILELIVEERKYRYAPWEPVLFWKRPSLFPFPFRWLYAWNLGKSECIIPKEILDGLGRTEYCQTISETLLICLLKSLNSFFLFIKRLYDVMTRINFFHLSIDLS